MGFKDPGMVLILVLVASMPAQAEEEDIITEYTTHAHAEFLDVAADGCSGSYKVIVRAKAPEFHYSWSWSVKGGGYDDGDSGFGPGPIDEGTGAQLRFVLNDGEVMNLAADIQNPSVPWDYSFDSASQTCDMS